MLGLILLGELSHAGGTSTHGADAARALDIACGEHIPTSG
jgi:hypothetical protein